ncbi:unnamed protein product [Paramecium sonneborni]|uniref:Uncharacterized protein n=1 Tax=Paramecium sonneborni TaxID=65129 RepID=A0A8S1MX11_9CILI|nr:unnamed protein product [Paramecium sonneborni]
MISINIKQEKKQRYKSVNSEERLKIIKYFIEGSLSASQIAQITGHNLSTIKAIFRIYKNEGRINKKEKRDRELHIQKNVAVFVVDEKTRYLNLIFKQHMKQEVILRSHDQFSEQQNDIINETLQQSANEVRNNMNSYQSKKNFDQALKRIQTNGIKEEDFQNISLKDNFQTNTYTQINGSTISNLFKNKQEQSFEKAQVIPPQKICIKQNQELNDLKRVFQQQVEEFLGKTHSDNLK